MDDKNKIIKKVVEEVFKIEDEQIHLPDPLNDSKVDDIVKDIVQVIINVTKK